MIEFKKVSKIYDSEGENPFRALDNVDIRIETGEFVAVVGPSGGGKSTLLHLIGCIDQPSDGNYWLDGENVDSLSESELARVRCEKVGFVFQAFYLLPRSSALDNVRLPMVYAGLSGSEQRSRARELLESVGLGRMSGKTPLQLSGGERQRVAIARALANGPNVLLGDEPTGNLDSSTGAEILELFCKLNREGKTVIIVTHDTQIARSAHRIIHLKDGKVVP